MSSPRDLAATDRPRLSDGTVVLRPWQDGDAPRLYEAARESIETVGRWLPWLDAGYDIEDSIQWVATSEAAWRAGDEFRFAILDAPEGRLLGGAGLNQLNRTHHIGNLGYWVRATATRQGVATRAARLVAHFGMTRLGLGRIEILTAPDNVASQRVAENAGARFEGLLRDRLMVRGRRIAARIYSLVGEDFGVVGD